MIPRKVKRDGALPGRTRGLPDICDANRVGLAGAAEAGGGGFILLILFIVISSD
jgi:hypothetical protein